jgi:hypothetical protein
MGSLVELLKAIESAPNQPRVSIFLTRFSAKSCISLPQRKGAVTLCGSCAAIVRLLFFVTPRELVVIRHLLMQEPGDFDRRYRKSNL